MAEEFTERNIGWCSLKDDDGYTTVAYVKRNKWGGFNIDLCLRNDKGKSIPIKTLTAEDGTTWTKPKNHTIRFYTDEDVTIDVPEDEL